ncbi:MAG: DUF4111 domain-containing protein [Ruminococcus sp.]|nr:DUF4111 domain-containing protein [Ruminococcus sp.]MBR2304990.1 DUF4111 domain-containing protein [Ruminococcus sp.]
MAQINNQKLSLNNSINEIIKTLTSLLDENIHSIWLYGSVVFNDFQSGWSDIDLITFTNKPITEIQTKHLLTLRQTLSEQYPDNPYYRCFEGAIVNVQEYISNSFTKVVYWGTSGQHILDRYEIDVFSRYKLALYGKSICGNTDRSIFTVPSREELVAAVRQHYQTIRKYAIQTIESIYSCGWLLDIARCIYTLRYNDIISKTHAGEWALNEHIFPVDDALRKALEIRRQPLEYKERDDINAWLSGLGETVQRYADVLERELNNTDSNEK